VKAELVIDRLSQLGEGVGKLDGRAVFVSGGFPGERLRVDVTPDAKVLRGQILELLEPSPERRAAVCPLADRCGGCDWMALDEVAQRAAKQESVLSALEHLAQIRRETIRVLPWTISPRGMGYRRRAVFHFTGGVLGLNARRSHARIAVPECPALVPRLAKSPSALSALLAPMAKDCSAVHVLAEGEAMSFAIALKRGASDPHRQTVERACRGVHAAGAVLLPEGGSPVVLGRPELPSPAPLRPKVQLLSRPDVFSQANGALVEGLAQCIVTAAGLDPTERALELFCGNGTFTFALADRCTEVYAVESSGTAVELASRSARQHGVANVRWVQGDAAKVAAGLASEGQLFDVLVADPPRTGAPGLGACAARIKARRVVYVACDAASLARDAADLRRSGFQPDTLALVDMFPQTHHVEAVVAFRRS
jgi:23S rRNA (uracil1939-C5)-methyltransferase